MNAGFRAGLPGPEDKKGGGILSPPPITADLRYLFHELVLQGNKLVVGIGTLGTEIELYLRLRA